MTLLPYVQLPTLELPLPMLGPLTLGPFGVLVAFGIVVGSRLTRRRARSSGLGEPEVTRLITWTVVWGLAGAHWVSVLGYDPDRLVHDPWLLLRFFEGISSVGGFLGGTAAFLWLTRHTQDRWLWADVLMYGLLAGFTIGRLGCALVHDHPGALLDPTHPLAVGPWPDGSHRYDLGLVEFVGMCALCLGAYLRTWRRPGTLTLTVGSFYCVSRFMLDALRAHDLRHAGLTPAQWATGLGLVAIIGLALRWRSSRPSEARA